MASAASERGMIMAEYVDKEAALSLVKPDAPEDEKAAVTIATAKKLVRSIIQRAPLADVAPVVHGRWIDAREYCGDYMCSNCEALYGTNKFNYCPNCGAKMGDKLYG